MNRSTTDFIKDLPNKESCNSLMGAVISGFDALPLGVDATHPRVEQLVGWCRHYFPQLTEEDIVP